MEFVGREDEFGWLDGQFDRVREGSGRFVALRGRRQVGKSRLVTEWLARRGHPHVYHQARGRPDVEQELASFADAVQHSSLGRLPDVVVTGVRWRTWDDALAAVGEAGAGGTLGDGPAVVVIDELPYLTASDPSFAATLQAAWDQRLQHTGILLVVIGSDLAMMEALATHGRPLYQRVIPKQVHPLNPAEVAGLLGVGATEALDTYLVTGGFPKILADRLEHDTTASFLDAAVEDEAHPLVHTGAQMLAAEFPPVHSPRDVLEAIGTGERAFGTIRSRAGVSERTVNDALTLLQTKHVITRMDPRGRQVVSGRTRYVVSDPYLRFWLRFLGPRTHDIARGRGDLVSASIRGHWQRYAGTAVEPLVREALERLLPDPRLGEARHVGSYWNRDHSTEVDLVGTREADDNDRVAFVGTVKWRETAPLDRRDSQQLNADAAAVPGADSSTVTIGVSRTGFDGDVGLDVQIGPDDLLAAWSR